MLNTKKEVCARAAISMATLDRLIRNRRIATVRIGRAVRIAESDLDAFIAKMKEV